MRWLLGQKKKAFEMLEKAFEDREVYLPFANVDANWDNMRTELQFVEILRKMNLPSSASAPMSQ